jgi:hypothetical protein
MALNINGTTGISGVDGSVSAPAVTGTDSNTGITFPSADTIKFATGGVERFAISNSGLSGDGSGLTGLTNGITMADQWRVSSSFALTGSVSIISSNWERVDAPSGYGTIGSAMTESSGVFTFPSTGIYYIEYICMLVVTNTAVRYCGNRVQTTVNNSSYSTAMETLGHIGISNSFGAYNTTTSSILFDVTDTSTHKIRFSATSITSSETTVIGNSTSNSTAVTFIRLGDT